jgi:hypothetical protein
MGYVLNSYRSEEVFANVEIRLQTTTGGCTLNPRRTSRGRLISALRLRSGKIMSCAALRASRDSGDNDQMLTKSPRQPKCGVVTMLHKYRGMHQHDSS